MTYTEMLTRLRRVRRMKWDSLTALEQRLGREIVQNGWANLGTEYLCAIQERPTRRRHTCKAGEIVIDIITGREMKVIEILKTGNNKKEKRAHVRCHPVIDDIELEHTVVEVGQNWMHKTNREPNEVQIIR